MGFEDLSIEDTVPIGRISIDRPPANVMSEGTIKELQTAFAELDTPDRKVIVVAGQEGTFSAGVEVEDHLGDSLAPMIRQFADLFRTIRSLETVTIASVDGLALGGGCELVAGCDVAIASAAAEFGQPEINLGTFPPVAAAMFPSIMGEKRAFEFVLGGERVGAEDAERLGLVNAVVPAEELEAETERYADVFAEKSATVLGMARQGFYEIAAQGSFEAAIELANDHAIEITSTEDGQEGLTAFMEDREPQWQD